MDNMTEIEKLVSSSDTFIIKQKKEWIEIFAGLETKNNYTVLDQNKNEVASISEVSGGFLTILKRFFLRSHRPFEFYIMNPKGERILRLHRKFFWFFSDLFVEVDGKKFGSIHRRFSLFYKKYSILDERGNHILEIKSIFWRLWTFRVKKLNGEEVSIITKKWQGILKEVFTDSDAYYVSFEKNLTPEMKVLLFSTGISIDFDYFENNQGSSGLLDFLGR